MSELVFNVPNVKYAQEIYSIPPAVERHYLMIRDAMQRNDKHTVGNRQLRLLHAGFEIPVTLEQCNRLLEKCDVTASSQ